MNTLKKIFLVLLIAAVVSFGQIGCKSHSEHPSGEHPTGEHPTGEQPSGEHPTGEHPSGEHPK